MDFESVRPILSGVVGGFITIWLVNKLEKTLPKNYGGKRIDEVIQENKAKIFISNILFFGIIFGGVILYKMDYLERNSWRSFLILAGVTMLSPMIFLFLASVRGGGQCIKEAFVAYAYTQRVPLGVLYGGFALGAICLFAVLGSMIGA